MRTFMRQNDEILQLANGDFELDGMLGADIMDTKPMFTNSKDSQAFSAETRRKARLAAEEQQERRRLKALEDDLFFMG